MTKHEPRTRMGAGLRIAAAAALLGPIAGCDIYDPQLRAGLWHPIHTNRANLTMMAAYPTDLVHGQSAPVTDGRLPAAAVDRLETNKLKKLPDSGLSEIQVRSQSGAE